MNIKKKLELMGWGAFTLGSLIFLIDNMRTGNFLGIIGSLIFMLGCFAFIAGEKF
jgi:hypothetical protein